MAKALKLRLVADLSMKVEALVCVRPPSRLRTSVPYVCLQEGMSTKDFLAQVKIFRDKLPARDVGVRVEGQGPVVDKFMEVFNGPTVAPPAAPAGRVRNPR